MNRIIPDRTEPRCPYHNGHYYSLNQYLREQFGEKVYKIALDGGMTCPNRDGTIGFGGCIFCSSGGSGDFAEKLDTVRQDITPELVTAQIEAAKLRIRKKSDARLFVAYYQSYTNTYAPAQYLKNLFTAAISHPDIVALSIGTRPDCLPEETLDLLEELNRIKPVWVELGLQTVHEDTARLIRRGYPLSVYERAVRELHKRNITVITHVILGLPGEDKERMLETVKYLSRQHEGCDGIKLQLLHVLKNTDLAALYEEGSFRTLEMEEYMDLIADALRLLPPDMVVHRLTGDGPKKLLIAPSWSSNKKLVLNTLQKKLREDNILQGSMYMCK